MGGFPAGRRSAVHHLSGEDLGGRDREITVLAVHGEGVAALHLAGDDLPADEGLHTVLHEAAQGTGAEGRVVGAVDDVLLGRRGEGHLELLILQAAVELGHQQIDDVGDVVLGEGLVEHNLVQPVEELGPEGVVQQIVDGTALSNDMKGKLEYTKLYPAMFNSPEHVEKAKALLEEALGLDKVKLMIRRAGGEDFSFMLQAKPGCLFRLGVQDETHNASVHNPEFDFNDKAIATGAACLLTIALNRAAS